MNNLHHIFHKTITIATVFGYDLMHHFSCKENSAQAEINQAFFEYTLQQFQSSEQLEMMQQILEVEQEKFSLRNTHSAQIETKLLSEYATFNHDRENLLHLSLEGLKNVTLQQSSYVTCYATDWKFVFINETDNTELLDKIQEFPKDEYYFVFQQTDVFDDVLQTNVLEFHLTKYEYYVLQLFQETTSVKEVLNDFFEVFEIESEAQMHSLLKEATRIIKFLIYRKFIVRSNILR
ncbi:hypothetical protein [Kordia sp.]|uniref:hypothetical protein n=1 Tax=Kordia sp. TaxID=1965332 RepID=UPI003D6A8F85